MFFRWFVISVFFVGDLFVSGGINGKNERLVGLCGCGVDGIYFCRYGLYCLF